VPTYDSHPGVKSAIFVEWIVPEYIFKVSFPALSVKIFLPEMLENIYPEAAQSQLAKGHAAKYPVH
jgi:hypothetical protein